MNESGQLIMTLEKKEYSRDNKWDLAQQMTCREEDGVLPVFLNISCCSMEAERGPLNSVIPAGILLQRLVYRIIATNID